MASKYTISTVFKGVDRMTRPVRKMGASISKMTESAEVGLRKIDAATSKVTESMFGAGKKAALGIAGLTSALVVGAGAVNQMKLESDNMTRAMGLSVETAEAVTSAIKGIGLGSENVTDLAEEMINKLGEVDPSKLGAVTDSFAQMGLNLRDVIKLNPEEQFNTITDALLKMEDATQAASAADQIFGGEGNKVIATLRLQGKSMEDITKNYQMLNFRTDQSRKGAEDMAKAQSKTAKIIGSLTQEVSGLIGKALAPMIDKFNEWMINNKALISQNLDKLFNSIGNSIGDVGQHMETLIGWIGDLGANFSEFIKWAKWVGIFVASLTVLSVALKTITVLVTAFNLAMAANPIVWVIAGITAAIVGLGFAVKYIYDNWGNISDWFSNMWDSIKTTFNIGVQMVKSMFDWSPMELISAQWDGVTNYFSNLFGGIASLYESTVGNVMGKVNAAKDFFGFGDDDEDIKRSMTIDANTVVTPQERISRSISENKETFDINVTGQNGAQVSSPMYSPRLNLINTGN